MFGVQSRTDAFEKNHALTRSPLDDVDDREAVVRYGDRLSRSPHARDQRCEGFDRARTVARERGFSPYVRTVGGRVVAYAGTTVAFPLAEPTENTRGARTAGATGCERVCEVRWRISVSVSNGVNPRVRSAREPIHLRN